jgi:hypothetical protein
MRRRIPLPCDMGRLPFAMRWISPVLRSGNVGKTIVE